MKYPLNKFVLLILFASYLNVSYAQNEQYTNTIGVNLQKSIALLSVNDHIEGDIYGAEIIYSINTLNNRSYWAKKLHVNSVDIILNYKNLSAMKVNGIGQTFGQGVGILTGVNIGVYKTKKPLTVNLLPALGIYYSSKTNQTSGNKLIGSHINFFAKLATQIDADISAKTAIFTEIDLIHFSNGAMKLPNLGANISSLGIGIKQKLGGTNKTTAASEMPVNNLKHQILLGVNFGKRGVDRGGNKGLYKNGFYLGYNYKINPLLAIAAGSDAVYYHSVYDASKNRATNQSYATSYDKWRIGLASGANLTLGKLNFGTSLGRYVHFANPKDRKFYWTFDTKYQFLELIALEAKLYVHEYEADFMGWGLCFSPFG